MITKLNTKDIYCDFILNKKIPVKMEWETPNVIAFRHNIPSWTFHIVIIPKKHITELKDVVSFDIIKEIFEVIQALVIKYNLSESNFKIVSNGGSFQDSKHLHFHLLSGNEV